MHSHLFPSTRRTDSGFVFNSLRLHQSLTIHLSFRGSADELNCTQTVTNHKPMDMKSRTVQSFKSPLFMYHGFVLQYTMHCWLVHMKQQYNSAEWLFHSECRSLSMSISSPIHVYHIFLSHIQLLMLFLLLPIFQVFLQLFLKFDRIQTVELQQIAGFCCQYFTVILQFYINFI